MDRWVSHLRRHCAFTVDRPEPEKAADHQLTQLLRSADFSAAADGTCARPIVAMETAITAHGSFDLFYLSAYFPGRVITAVTECLPAAARWRSLAYLYEAWWNLASRGEIPGDVEARAQRTAAAYFTRTRWLIYAVYYRAMHTDDLDLSPMSTSGSQEIVRGRQARADWLVILDEIEDHPLLAQDIDPEKEARYLLDVRLGGIDGDAIDRETWRHCVRQYLLPRFAVGSAWRLAYRMCGWAGRLATIGAVSAFASAVVLLVLGLTRVRPGWSAGLITAATAAAAAGYLTIVAAGVAERAATWPWLLRQPASAMLGVLALITIGPDWWTDPDRRVVVGAAVTLVCLAIGYLVVETVNHRVHPPVAILRRAATVAAFGCLHSLMAAAIALRWMVPALSPPADVASPSGTLHDSVACLWQAAGCRVATPAPLWVFALAAAWCFAAGVFSQILWDEQPYTAPLAHLGWRHRE